MSDNMIYLDRNEFNFEPSSLVKETFRNFDINTLCFYTRIYDQGKKSILSVYLSELYGIDERQVILGYGAEDLLKMAIHFFLTEGDNRTILIPKFSWWYYKSIASEVNGVTDFYPLYETEDSFRYDLDELEQIVKEKRPRILLIASPNHPTGNGLTMEETKRLMDMVPEETLLLMDEAYASFVNTDTSYIKELTEIHPNVIFCRTFSKFYGLPGLRMGFGFTGKSELMERFGRYANKYLGYDRLSEELGIAALKLGAKHVDAVDIDMVATRIAGENAEKNGIPEGLMDIYCGNILTDGTLCESLVQNSYSLILANIVADIISDMLPFFARCLDAQGHMICSGIISPRRDFVVDALGKAGFVIESIREKNEWVAIVCRKS